MLGFKEFLNERMSRSDPRGDSATPDDSQTDSFKRGIFVNTPKDSSSVAVDRTNSGVRGDAWFKEIDAKRASQTPASDRTPTTYDKPKPPSEFATSRYGDQGPGETIPEPVQPKSDSKLTGKDAGEPGRRTSYGRAALSQKMSNDNKSMTDDILGFASDVTGIKKKDVQPYIDTAKSAYDTTAGALKYAGDKASAGLDYIRDSIPKSQPFQGFNQPVKPEDKNAIDNAVDTVSDAATSSWKYIKGKIFDK